MTTPRPTTMIAPTGRPALLITRSNELSATVAALAQ